MEHTLKFSLSLLLLTFIQPVSSESIRSIDEIRKERFSVEMTVGARHRISSVSFRASDRRPIAARLVEQRAIEAMELERGTVIFGTFAFNSLSGTDLGSGRVYSGVGTLTFDQLVKPDGKPAGCPPLCENAVRLAVEFRAPR